MPRPKRRRCRAALMGVVVLAAGLGVSNSPRASAEAPSTPRVHKATMLSGGGGNQDWSHARDLIIYDKPDQKGNSQIRTIRPDGGDDRCLSCTAVAGGPPVDRHKVVPIWHPSGQWAVTQVESPFHLLALLRNSWLKELVINGMAASLWAVSSDGRTWRRLTNEKSPTSYGVMAAHFSADGRHLLFSRLVQPATAFHPWGKYRLVLANFAVDGAGRPMLTDERDITPSGHDFAEAHGFSPDGSEVLFASYAGNRDTANFDIWKLGLATRRAVRLTSSRDWDEHATFCPNGKNIVYFNGYRDKPLSGELWVATTDGASHVPLTSFNRPANPGYVGERTMVMRPTFNADATRMAVTTQLARSYPAHRQLWVLDVAGVCT